MDLGFISKDNKVQLWLFFSLLGSSLEPVLIKLVRPDISPLSLIVLKSLVGSALIIPFHGRLKKLRKCDVISVIHVSLLAFVTNALIFLSLQSIPATTLITIITTTPLLVALLNHKKGNYKISFQFVLAFFAVFAGVLLTLEVMVKDVAFTFNFGVGIALLSVLTSAFYRLKMDSLTQVIDPFVVSTALFTFTGIFSLCLLPMVEIPQKLIPFGLWLGFAGVVANISFLYAIKHLGSTRVSVFSLIQRPLAVIMGAFLLREIISPLQILGMSFIFTGIYFARMKTPKLQST